MEEWKEIKGTDGKIFISSKGRVKSLLTDKQRILKATPDTKGYMRLRVTINRQKLSFKVHREVAKAFIPNPNNLPQVNHIDGNKANNDVSNLEWITNRDNVIHAISSGLWKEGLHSQKDKWTPIVATNGKETLHFQKLGDAEKYFGTRHISDVCKGKRSHAKGWKFAYERGD